MTLPHCLLDTSVLVALLHKTDQYHERAKRLMEQVKAPLITSEPVLTEACFLMGKTHPAAPAEVIELGKKGFYEIGFCLKEQYPSIIQLLKKYQDHSISLADACLIRCAELHREGNILTFDSDFQFYRWGKNKRFILLG